MSPRSYRRSDKRSPYGPRAERVNSNSPLAVRVIVHLLLCTSV